MACSGALACAHDARPAPTGPWYAAAAVRVTPELVCIGLATADVVVPLSRWPDRDGRQVVDAFHRAGGGPAATAAVAAARLGRHVAFIGAIGRDEVGASVRAQLAAAGVDLQGLRDEPGRTSESLILVDRDTGSRSIIHAPGAALDGLDDAARDLCLEARWVHVDHAGWALAGGLPRERLSVDAGNPIPDLDIRGLGLYAPTEASIRRRYPGRDVEGAVAAALAEGALRVVVTLGADGAVAAEASGAWRVAGVAGLEIVSTLGAGDVFHGALLAGLLDAAALPDAVVAANVAAALSCRAMDGRAAIPDPAALRRALQDGPSARPIDLKQE